MHLIGNYMALNVMKLCRTRALLTRSKITPEIGLARLAALNYDPVIPIRHVAQFKVQQ